MDMKASLIYLLFFLLPLAGLAQELIIRITGFRSQAGSVRLQIFDTAEHFDRKQALLTRTSAKAAIVNGELQVTVSNLKPGSYGLAVLDDENNNAKMDYGLVLPSEGFGFSDYYHSSLTSPRFERFEFVLGHIPKTVTVKLR